MQCKLNMNYPLKHLQEEFDDKSTWNSMMDHYCIHHIIIIIIIIIIITSTSDLQPSTPTANQLPGQLVSTEIRTTYV